MGKAGRSQRANRVFGFAASYRGDEKKTGLFMQHALYGRNFAIQADLGPRVLLAKQNSLE